GRVAGERPSRFRADPYAAVALVDRSPRRGHSARSGNAADGARLALVMANRRELRVRHDHGDRARARRRITLALWQPATSARLRGRCVCDAGAVRTDDTG